MRAFTVLVLALAAVPSALAIQRGSQGSPASVSLSAGSYRVLYGHSTTISGRVHGGAVGGLRVVIEAHRYGRSAPLRVAAVRTSANGAWSVRVKPLIRTTYQAHIGRLTSRRVAVGVAPAVSVKELPNGRLRVQVKAWHAFGDRLVQLQELGPGRAWKTVDRKPLSSASIAVIAPAIGTSTVRMAISVNQAGAGYLGGASHALAYRPVALWLTPTAGRVLFGHALMLEGRLLNSGRNEHITIYSRPYGTASLKPLETVTTTRDGRFRLLVQPTIQTTYEARLGGTRKSLPLTIGVQPTLSILAATGRSVRVQVGAGKPLRGRMVELQRLVGADTWRTIAKRPLGATSTATFHLTLPRTTIRAAMSVNQAGAGYLGTFSHPLLVPAV